MHKHIAATVVADISEAVREKVVHRMQQVPTLDIDSTEEKSVSEEEITPRPKKRKLKSGKLRTANTTIVHKVTWPHELVYRVSGQSTLRPTIRSPTKDVH